MIDEAELATKGDLRRMVSELRSSNDHLHDRLDRVENEVAIARHNIGEVYRLVRRGMWTLIFVTFFANLVVLWAL